jgi:hypothetical protein
MPGIGDNDTKGRLVTIRETMPGDIDGILEAIRRIILMGDIRSVSLRHNEPITYQRILRPGEEIKSSESTASFAELSPIDVVRQISMEEYVDESLEDKSPHSRVMRMFLYMGFDGWVTTHLLMGEKTGFWDWLNVPSLVHKRLNQFLGARIEREKTLPEDVFVLCGAKTKSATIAEIGYALKGNVG